MKNAPRVTTLLLIKIILVLEIFAPMYPIHCLESSNQLPWHLNKINIEDAWTITNGSSNISVAILDSGIDFSHPDLNHSAWLNEDEILDGQDNDNNGYIDDIYGWDWVNDDNNPSDDENDTINFHGTFIAGLITSKGSIEEVIGCAPNLRLMALRVIDFDSMVTPDGLIKAIEYAVDNGADVISMSLELLFGPPGFLSSIRKTQDANIAIVAGTGNDGVEGILIPASFSEIIAVGASNKFQEKADYSNWGEEIELVAPVGDKNYDSIEDILKSTAPGNSYTYGYGTSFAVPQVAAVIGLIKSVRNDLPIETIREILHKTATDIPPTGWDSSTGYGIVNASAALRMAVNYDEGTSNENRWLFFTPYPLITLLVAIIVLSYRKRSKNYNNRSYREDFFAF